jgi:hypothetical protein
MIKGTIAPAAAHELVDRALAMRAQVREVLPPDLTVTKLAADVKTAAPQTRTPERLQALVRFAAYRVFVERHFLGPKSRWMTGRDQ